MTTRAYFRQWRAAQWARDPGLVVDLQQRIDRAIPTDEDIGMVLLRRRPCAACRSDATMLASFGLSAVLYCPHLPVVVA